MTQFSKFAAEFVFVATLLMVIIIMLFLGILIMLFSEKRSRKKESKKIIDSVEETNKLFKKVVENQEKLREEIEK